MEKYEIEKLRSLSCEGVAQRLGIKVQHHKALCPFHSDHTPSLTFKKNKYRCWSCGASGDTISLVEKVLHKDFREACRWLADEHNVILTEYKPDEEKSPKPFDPTRYQRHIEHPWLNEEARRFLFDERRIDPRVASWCRLSSFKDRNGVPWLSIPYFDSGWHLIGIQYRNLVKGGLPRFRFPQGCDVSLYGLQVLSRVRQGGNLFIAEGVTDCLALLSSGRPAIAAPSATLLSKKNVELLQSLSASLSLTFHMYHDQDAPGERLFLQLKEILPSLVHHQLPPGCKDFSDLYTSKFLPCK
jgi:hypothetical protein